MHIPREADIPKTQGIAHCEQKTAGTILSVTKMHWCSLAAQAHTFMEQIISIPCTACVCVPYMGHQLNFKCGRKFIGNRLVTGCDRQKHLLSAKALFLLHLPGATGTPNILPPGPGVDGWRTVLRCWMQFTDGAVNLGTHSRCATVVRLLLFRFTIASIKIMQKFYTPPGEVGGRKVVVGEGDASALPFLLRCGMVEEENQAKHCPSAPG